MRRRGSSCRRFRLWCGTAPRRVARCWSLGGVAVSRLCSAAAVVRTYGITTGLLLILLLLPSPAAWVSKARHEQVAAGEGAGGVGGGGRGGSSTRSRRREPRSSASTLNRLPPPPSAGRGGRPEDTQQEVRDVRVPERRRSG